MNTGQKVSAGLHIGLILWVMLFDLFSAPEDSMIPDVTEVSLISSQDFAELMQPLAVPAPAPIPAPAARPDAIVPPAPVPPVAPAPTAAPIAPPPPVTPPEPPQAAVVAPQTTPQASLTPVQRPAERVAPQAAPTPEPEVTIAPTDQAAVAPDATAVVQAPEAQEATQRAAAATETVTEATRLSETEPAQRTATAPEVSIRPRSRPAVPVAAPAPTPPPAVAQPATPPTPEAPVNTGPTSSAIEDALAEALAGALDEPAALSASVVDGLRLNIESCWNVGILSTEALNVVITIAFEMTIDARPIENTIRQVSASGGSFAAQQAAFDAGRQAIVQCGTQGYGLPQDLYDQWQLVEITFNPARMSTR